MSIFTVVESRQIGAAESHVIIKPPDINNQRNPNTFSVYVLGGGGWIKAGDVIRGKLIVSNPDLERIAPRRRPLCQQELNTKTGLIDPEDTILMVPIMKKYPGGFRTKMPNNSVSLHVENVPPNDFKDFKKGDWVKLCGKIALSED